MNAAERFFFEGEPTFSPTTGAGLSKDVWAKIDGLEKRHASGGLVKVVAADGDGPAPFEVGLDLMSGETGETGKQDSELQ